MTEHKNPTTRRVPTPPELVENIKRLFTVEQLANPDMQEICRIACALAEQGKING